MKKIALFSTMFFLTMAFALAQDVEIPQIGSKAPSFTAASTNGKINFPSDFGKNWKIIFSHPKDFTPVCSSEILELAYAQKSFDDLGAKLIVLSTDILEQHKSWKSALEEIPYKDRAPVKITFPIVADNDLEVSKLYGMIHTRESMTQNIRGVYFIDPENTIRAIYFYPNEVGRNVDELKRTLVALETTRTDNSIVTPANWQAGDDVLVPIPSKEQKNTMGLPTSDLYQVSWFMTYKKSD